MFDFINFIELLKKMDSKDSLKDALFSTKDELHIGKIKINSLKPLYSVEYVLNADFDEKVFLVYSCRGFEFEFYKANDNYVFNDDEIRDINLLIRIIGLFYNNKKCMERLENAELISSNTRLLNSHGYIREVTKLLSKVDPTTYNLYFINLKGFAIVNKLYGSDGANEAIIAYANKLKDFIKQDEVIGHLGGDNFVAFIKRDRHQQFIDLVTKCPVKISNYDKLINLIGIVGYDMIDDPHMNPSAIITNPSMACQYARNTKKQVVNLTYDLMDMIESVKSIESSFKDELNGGNFIVYYQPKFDIKSGKIIGVEALSRWMKNGKIIPPGVFVPILEKSGEIINLDLFVLESLCKDIHNYRNMGHKIVPASCNLSRRDFELDDIEQRVIDIIKKYNVKTKDIVIEVTETMSLEEKERLSTFISTMHKNGIMTSIDDFGTGYSSLSVLRDFQVNEIKIDRSFINRESLINSDKIIIGSIIDMAKRLNINVICEGVETINQANFLVELGCNNAQGFLYSKPVPKLEFEAMLQKIGTINAND